MVLLLSADRHLCETSLSVCGSAERTKQSLSLRITAQSKVQVIPSGAAVQTSSIRGAPGAKLWLSVCLHSSG